MPSVLLSWKRTYLGLTSPFQGPYSKSKCKTRGSASFVKYPLLGQICSPKWGKFGSSGSVWFLPFPPQWWASPLLFRGWGNSCAHPPSSHLTLHFQVLQVLGSAAWNSPLTGLPTTTWETSLKFLWDTSRFILSSSLLCVACSLAVPYHRIYIKLLSRPLKRHSIWGFQIYQVTIFKNNI